MVGQLRLALWPSPAGVVLAEIETAVLAQLMPPLNLEKVTTPWRSIVRAARERLAGQAHAWAPVAAAGLDAPTGEAASAVARPLRALSGRVVGIDAAGKFGWAGVTADADGYDGARLGTLREIIDWAEPVDVIGIDIPIGHGKGGVRRADVAARGFVGHRGSSVFAAPHAEVLVAGSYAEANEILAARALPLLSRQAWALVPRIVETGAVADGDARLFEVHPEVSFRALAGETLRWSKKSWNGIHLRRRLLAEAGIVLPDVITEVDGAVADDIVDAAASAWSARRIANGSARSFPDPPEESNGRRVAIWY